MFPGDYEYYLWRTGVHGENGQQATEPATEPAGNNIPREAKGISRDAEKEMRRTLRQLASREDAVLKRLEQLETEHDECQQELAKEENYTDGAIVRRLSGELERLGRERGDLNENWSNIEKEIREIRESLRASGRDA